MTLSPETQPHYVMVGSMKCPVSDAEWLVTQLAAGQTIWFRHRVGGSMLWEAGAPMTPWKQGTFRHSWFYDGIVAEVYEDDPDDLIRHSLRPDFGDEIAVERPTRHLVACDLPTAGAQ